MLPRWSASPGWSGQPVDSTLALALAITKPVRTLRLESGFCESGGLVSIGGNLLVPVWLEQVAAVPGDPLTLLILDYSDSTSSQPFVLGVPRAVGATALPLPIEGTIKTFAAGSLTAVVTTAQGDQTAVVRSNYAPVVGDRVRLSWARGANGSMVCDAVAKIGAVPLPERVQPERPSPPPPEPETGSDVFTASDSGTWSTGTGEWNTEYGTDVYAGTGFGAPGDQHGAWFYQDALALLRGRTPTGVRLFLPARLMIGDYDTPASITINRHTSKTRPSGDVTIAASTTITVAAASDEQWIDLPTGWGPALIAGDGICISGTALAGFSGIKDNSGSGRIHMDWEA